MPPPKAARIAAATSTLCALGVVAAAAAGSTRFAMIGGAAAAVAAIMVLVALSRTQPASAAEPLAVVPATQPVERAPRKREGTLLLATLRNMEDGSERVVGDLQRVLAGIVADEKGAIERSEGHTVLASFAKTDHAAAAVHAAQRMLSNVDAVSRRLGHDLKLAVGVHSGARGEEETIAVAMAVQAAATDTVPVLVSEASARHLEGQLERVDTLAGEGFALDVFTFPPAQKRLPGF
jgi:class 3 adenylate cyclase